MAAKEKQIFFCKECGYESAKWQGQCPGCRAWNTFVEEKVKVGVKGAVKQPSCSSRSRLYACIRS